MRRTAFLPALALVTVMASALSGCATAYTTTAGAAGSAPAGDAAISFTVMGDSNTAANLGTLDDGLRAAVSWPHFTEQQGLLRVGGVARNGYTMPQLARLAQPEQADVLVVMAGTNDLTRGVRREATLAALEWASEVVGAQSVLVVAVPPRTGRGAETDSMNAWLAEMASERGWDAVDPWRWTRGSDGGWADPACAADALHATPAAYERMGLEIARHLTETAGRAYLGTPPESVTC